MADMKPVPARVKEEPGSDRGQNLDLPPSAVHIKVEPRDYEEPPHANHPQYLTNHIKEESRDYKEGLPPHASPPPYSSLCIKEEAESGEEDLEEALEYTTVCIKEEPASGDFLPVNIGGRGISGVFPDEESDGPSDRTEIEYTAVRIKGEESSEEDYAEAVADNYATRDHTYMVTRTEERLKAPGKSLSCSQCGKVFFGKAAYRLHQKLHRGEAACGKKFSRMGSCQKHQEAGHVREKSFPCPNCERSFSSKLGVTLHQRVHTREPAFSCQDCAQSFTSNSALIQHRRVHYADRRLACAKCGATFHNKSDLINHQILHPAQQSFACSECGQKFPTKAELSAHWKVHTVIEAFAWRKIHFTHQEETPPTGQ